MIASNILAIAGLVVPALESEPIAGLVVVPALKSEMGEENHPRPPCICPNTSTVANLVWQSGYLIIPN